MSTVTDDEMILRALRFYAAEAIRISHMPYIGKREIAHRQKHLDLAAEVELLILRKYGRDK